MVKAVTEKEWAERLAELMSKEEFSAFAEFLDGCDDVDFSGACAEIDEKNFPEKYGEWNTGDGEVKVELNLS